MDNYNTCWSVASGRRAAVLYQVLSSFTLACSPDPPYERRKEVSDVQTWLQREDGQGLVEYGLIIFLVAIVIIAILVLLGPQIGSIFSGITGAS